MQGNVCPRFIFAVFPSLSAGEFNIGHISLYQIIFPLNSIELGYIQDVIETFSTV